MEGNFDLAVIGGGPGGYVAAIRASQLGLKVVVVEEREMGGTCLNRGCIPTKVLLRSAEVFQEFGRCSEYGISASAVEFDYSRINQRKASIVKRLRTGVESLVRGNGGTIIPGKARLIDRHTVEVAGTRNTIIKAEKLIIATGSRPSKPSIPGMDGSRVLDSDQVLELKECPSGVVIIGGGVIGIEFATLFNLLGKKVAIIEMMESLIPGFDGEISGLLKASLESKGVRICTGSMVTGIESGASAVCSFVIEGQRQSAEGEIAIVATGRKPNTESLGLDALGVTLDRGYIKVNERMQTSIEGIYAIGDVTGVFPLAHVASAQGIVAAENAAGMDHAMDYSVIPSCIYSNPEIATVGLTEEKARKTNKDVGIGRFPVSTNGKSMILGEKEGLAKIITDSKTGEILGAHIMGPRATELIGELCVAMRLEATTKELSETIHPHPTVSEIIMEASMASEGRCVHVH
ncbi:MAG: dihydrolipoyl dehydrogenase [Spirochaetota bacterium]